MLCCGLLLPVMHVQGMYVLSVLPPPTLACFPRPLDRRGYGCNALDDDCANGVSGKEVPTEIWVGREGGRRGLALLVGTNRALSGRSCSGL